jgi:hypothetical protein
MHESETSKFRNTLNEKIKSLSYAEEEQKERALKRIERMEARKSDSSLKLNLNTFNGKLPSLYNLERSSAVEKLVKENKDVYEKYKDTSLFKGFPSPNRSEYLIKRGEKISNRRKKLPDFTIDVSHFHANKHRTMFCEKNNINDGYMLKFENKTQTFT